MLVHTDIRAIRLDNTMLIMKKDRRRSLNRSLTRAVGESARSCCSCGSNGDAMDEYPGDVQLFINGSYVDGASEERQHVRSPVIGDVIGSVPVPSRADIDAAVAAATAAQGRWGRVGVWERAKVCHAIGDALRARCEQLARLQPL